jgi:ankyrin repeat protein
MFSFFRQRRKQAELRQAIRENNVERVSEMIREGLNVNLIMNDRYMGPTSLLCVALAAVKLEIVDLLIARGASPAQPGNESFLVLAVRAGDHKLIDLALDAGFNIHYRPNGLSAFQAAVFKNNLAVMKQLIARGATKDDFDARQCRWVGIHAPTIRLLLSLGVDVPGDLLEHVKNEAW